MRIRSSERSAKQKAEFQGARTRATQHVIMLQLNVHAPLGRGSVSFIRLPATVIFPTNDKLLERIEKTRKTLPPNSIKALRRDGLGAASSPRAP